MTFKAFIDNSYDLLAFFSGVVLLFFAGGLAWTILWRMWTNKINLSLLVSEKTGEASMSRLQLLIFTFVIGLSLFVIVVGAAEGPRFPAAFPPEILTLLGISGSSYLVSKAIQSGSTATATRPRLTISSTTVGSLAPGASADFSLRLMNVPSGTAIPNVTWSLDAPSLGTITPISPDKARYQAPMPSEDPATVNLRAQATGFEDGTATISLS